MQRATFQTDEANLHFNLSKISLEVVATNNHAYQSRPHERPES